MSGNPFVPVEAPAAPAEPELPDVVFGSQEVLEGPASPSVAPPVVGEVQSWPTVEAPAGHSLYVAGLHASAPSTTIARLLTGSELADDAFSVYDAGEGWPVSAGWVRPRPPLNVVAVYRPHRAGVEAARSFARTWASAALADSHLLGIIAVDDGPSLLQAQRAAIRQIARMTPHGWHVPWVEEWRIEEPDFGAIPRRIRKTLRSIRRTTKDKGVQA